MKLIAAVITINIIFNSDATYIITKSTKILT